MTVTEPLQQGRYDMFVPGEVFDYTGQDAA
jgi:hypothetical protein